MCYNIIREFEQYSDSCADIAQSVERILGKDEVTSSNLVISSRNKPSRYAGRLISLNALDPSEIKGFSEFNIL